MNFNQEIVNFISSNYFTSFNIIKEEYGTKLCSKNILFLLYLITIKDKSNDYEQIFVHGSGHYNPSSPLESVLDKFEESEILHLYNLLKKNINSSSYFERMTKDIFEEEKKMMEAIRIKKTNMIIGLIKNNFLDSDDVHRTGLVKRYSNLAKLIKENHLDKIFWNIQNGIVSKESNIPDQMLLEKYSTVSGASFPLYLHRVINEIYQVGLKKGFWISNGFAFRLSDF